MPHSHTTPEGAVQSEPEDDYLQWAHEANAGLEPMSDEALRCVAKTYAPEGLTPEAELAESA